MAVVFDPDKRTVTLSVSDLLGDGPSYRIGFSGGASLKRMWLGQGIHSKYQVQQLASEPTYRREVPVAGEFSLLSWTALLQGRLDGLYRDGKRSIVVEEIKSLHFSRDWSRIMQGETGEGFRRQVALYGYLWKRAEGGEVTCKLILIDVVSGERRVIPVPFDTERMGRWVEGRLIRIIRGYEREEQSRSVKRESAGKIPFPYPSFRPHQEEMIQAVTRTLQKKRDLLVEAPTGVGKTVAALYPALRFTLANSLNLLFLTAKTLQQEIAVSTLKAMNVEGGFHSLQLRAKGLMCANAEMICHEDFCPYARDYKEKLRTLRSDEKLLAAFGHLDPDIIFATGLTDEICPFELSLELARKVDVVVCDYNYVFDPSIALRETEEGVGLGDTVLLIDEAHNLVDRGRAIHSPKVTTALMDRSIALLKLFDDSSHEGLLGIILSLKEEVEALAEAHLTPPRDSALIPADAIAFTDYLEAMEEHILDYIAQQSERGIRRREEPVLELYFTLVKMVRNQDDGGDEFVWIVERDHGGVALEIFCRDASRFLGEVIEQAWSAVAMSATLQPFDFYRTLLGFPGEKSDTEAFPSPFPDENRLVLVVPSIETVYRKRRESLEPLTRILYEMGHGVKGNFLILLPSYAYLDQVLNLWPARGGKRCIVQRHDLKPKERREIISALEKGEEELLLFGVSGGMYAEGLDYPGEMLRGVFIVSPSLPQVGVRREVLKRYYEERYERGFSYAYLIPGMRRVIQAAGRVIRSEEDRGAIALICRRFTDGRYTRYFPKYWYTESAGELVVDDPVKMLKTFFGEEHETANTELDR